jgi:hypothetical protein
MEVGAADGASLDLDEQLAGTGSGRGEFGGPEGLTRGIEKHGAHTQMEANSRVRSSGPGTKPARQA